jgi:hypothetical protein
VGRADRSWIAKKVLVRKSIGERIENWRDHVASLAARTSSSSAGTMAPRPRSAPAAEAAAPPPDSAKVQLGDTAALKRALDDAVAEVRSAARQPLPGSRRSQTQRAGPSVPPPARRRRRRPLARRRAER